MSYVLVLYYSRYGATAKMAERVARGIETVAGMEARLRTVPHVSPVTEATQDSIPAEGPPYVTSDDFKEAAGICVGSPTRFGNMAAPLKYFLDTTGGLWQAGALIDKPVGAFTSSASLHGGQESTLLTMLIPFIHHGAIFVGLPYSEADLHTTQTGGTPYGPSHVTKGNNDQPLSDEEQRLCAALGKRVATIAAKLAAKE